MSADIRRQPFGQTAAWPGASEAGERTDAAQIDAEIAPEEAEPAESGDGGSADERREIPELLAVVQPNVGVAEQAAPDPAGVYGVGLNRHLRGELGRRGSGRLLAARSSRAAGAAGETRTAGKARTARTAGKTRAAGKAAGARAGKAGSA